MHVLKYLLGLILILALLWALGRLLKIKKAQFPLQLSLVLIIALFLLELCLNVLFYTESRSWLFLLNKHPNRDLFEKHPYLAVTNRPNADEQSGKVRIQHNQDGLRSTTYSEEELHNSTTVLTIGGSTTYGVGVNNHEIWPYYLDSLIGPESLVVNVSVPGHSTVEHLVYAALYIEKYEPDVIILLTGLNDLRNSHVKNLRSDYSNFHEPHLLGSMGQCYLEYQPKIASLYYLTRIGQKMGLYPVCDFHKAQINGSIGNGVDSVALLHYKQNLRKLIYMCKYYTDDVLVMPQVLIDEMVKDNGLAWWIPYIPAKELTKQLRAFNEVSREVAYESNCVFLNSVSNHVWNKNDFVDPSHFNAQANKKLALIIEGELKSRQIEKDTID